MLSPRKLNSPSKENASPHRPQSPQKNSKAPSRELLMSVVQELQAIVIRSGGTVPEQLTLGLQPTLKLVRADSQDQKSSRDSEVKRLKVRVSDYEFELKKIEEDFAGYKIITRMEREKEVRRLRDEILRLERQCCEDNAKWESKLQQMKQLYSLQCEAEQEKAQRQSCRLYEQLRARKEAELLDTKGKYEERINVLMKEQEEKVRRLEQDLVESAKAQQERVEREADMARKKLVEVVKKMESKQQEIKSTFEVSKRTQDSKYQEEVMAFNKTKEKLYTDLYLVRREKEQLEKVLQQLKNRIVEKDNQKELLMKQMKAMEEQHQSDIAQQRKQFEDKCRQNDEQLRQKCKKLYQDHQAALREIKKEISNIHSEKKEKEKLLHESKEELERKFEERGSRPEDLEKLRWQKHELVLKEEKINSLQQEVKRARLEKDNNEKNYTRIFSSQGSRTKKINIEKDSQRERLYKQANTIDMSFLLKVCQKQF